MKLAARNGNFLFRTCTDSVGSYIQYTAVPDQEVPTELYTVFLEVLNRYHAQVPRGNLSLNPKARLVVFNDLHYFNEGPTIGPATRQLIEKTATQAVGIQISIVLPILNGVARDRRNPRLVVEEVLERTIDPELMPLSSAMPTAS